ncbi:unnamed protein product [Aphanomyces euteiches]
MTTYEEPEWALNGSNSHGLSLEVIKSGSIVDTIQLSTKSFFVAGRMEPLCDLVLQHPSVSRTHATFQFDRKGRLFLYDMSSTHGTFVNKKRIPAGEYTQVHVGDVIVFGESSRIYTVLGPPELMPEEYSSANLAKLRQKLDERKQQQRDKEDEGISWGFGEDAVNESDEDDDENDDEDDKKANSSVSKRSNTNLPDYLRNRQDANQTPYVSKVTKDNVNLAKDEKLYTRLQSKIQKMENLKLESTRIRAKQNVGLTDGQQVALGTRSPLNMPPTAMSGRCEGRIQALEEEIETLEAQLLAKHTQRTTQRELATTSKKKSQHAYDDDSDDDFYDRTKATNNPSTAGTAAATRATTKPKVMTMESIQATLNGLRQDLASVEKEVEKLPDTATDSATETEDSLDAYMQESNRQLRAQERAKALAEQTRLEGLIREQQALLDIATPAWAKLKASNEAAHAPQDDNKNAAEPALSAKQKESLTTGAREVATSPRRNTSEMTPVSPLKVVPAQTRAPSVEENKAREPQKTALEPPKQKRVEADAASPPSKRRKPQGPARPAPAPAAKPSKLSYDQSVLEGGDVVWQPPKNQTGDGRTALNDKYGY